jgi:demethylmenaquinone methyltransferase/2-methoxy-6-polyprenyl-1,4-benzoquinol methylase
MTHFGYQQVTITEKTQLVTKVFDKVALRYDLMNDLMSLGLHRWWKKIAFAAAAVYPGHKVLDIASGTGDLAMLLVKAIGTNGCLVVSDINSNMLCHGRKRLINQGLLAAHYLQADAECLPLPHDYFDCITIAFGLRNITNKASALTEMYRVLTPGGKVVILEFSQVELPLLQYLYDAFSFKIIPRLGSIIANDRDSYQYLVESIRQHPPQAQLQQMLEQAGFEDVSYTNLSGGIVALHTGYKY